MLDKTNIPQHIAIIMDGNGRWANERGLPRAAGHSKGMERVEQILKAAADLGVKVITVFAFSVENWKRPKNEVDMLMQSMENYLSSRLADLMKNNVAFNSIGRGKPLSDKLQERLRLTKEATRNNTGLIFNVAVNYGSRQEILDAAKKIAQEAKDGRLDIESIDEEKFSEFLDTRGLPDPDLLIRTSGELRISNFLLWQISYAELYFTKKSWPDFGREDLEAAIEEYQSRQRRFGKIGADADQKVN